MAATVLTNAMILAGAAWTGTSPGAPGTQTIAGTITSTSDLSAYCTNVELPEEVNMVDAANFGSGGYMIRLPGLKSAGIGLGFINDYAGSALDQILRVTFGFGTLIYLDIKPTNSARSATNPSFVFATYISDYKPIVGSVGALSAPSVNWQTTGAFGYLTA